MPFRLRLTSLTAAAITASLCMIMMLYPAESLSAAVRGINIWWGVLFPSLFPFLVVSELLLGIGIVHFVGTILDPLMRPLFRVSGKGGFVMAMGFASGYPVGARLTSQLWSQRLVTREEGERLVAFTSTSDPIFLIGAVSVGFFYNPSLAVILAIAHYMGSVITGLLLRFHGRDTLPPPFMGSDHRNIWTRAFQAMHQARLQNKHSPGELLEQSVQSSLRLVFVIGGLVVFFSVLMELLSVTGVLAFFYLAAESGLHLFHLPNELAPSLVGGLFEVTLGAKFAAQAGEQVPLMYKAAAASMVLSWAGLSVHAQIISLLNRTPFRYMPFIIARVFHAIISFILVLLLWNPLQKTSALLTSALPVWNLSDWSNEHAFSLYFILAFSLFIMFGLAAAILFGIRFVVKSILRSIFSK